MDKKERKHDPEKIHLKIDNVQPFFYDGEGGIVIMWSSDIGFGQYTFSTRGSISDPNHSKMWVAESECMDDNTDQAFGRKLLQLWMDQVFIIE